MPLSFAQKRLWFLDQLEPGNSTYNLSMPLRIEGRLNLAALSQSINEVVRRHEALRTVFQFVEDEPRQVVETYSEKEVCVVDVRGLGEGKRRRKAVELARKEAGRPFDLRRGPVMRAALVEVSEEEWVLLLSMHHIVTDGWSMGVLLDEMGRLYRRYSQGEESGLKELGIQYRDYAYWHNRWLEGEVYERQMGYWREQLGGASQEMRLGTDRVRPAVQSYEGKGERVRVGEELTREVRELGRREGASLYMTMLAAMKVVLYRHSGEEDVVVGSPIANRGQEEVEGLIGFFVNTLVMRTEVSGDQSFRELLGRVREVALGAYANQDVPFERLVEEMQPERSLSRTPLFQVMFALQDQRGWVPELTGLRVRKEKIEIERAKFELTTTVAEVGGELEIRLQYRTELYEGETVRRMGRALGERVEGSCKGGRTEGRRDRDAE